MIAVTRWLYVKFNGTGVLLQRNRPAVEGEFIYPLTIMLSATERPSPGFVIRMPEPPEITQAGEEAQP